MNEARSEDSVGRFFDEAVAQCPGIDAHLYAMLKLPEKETTVELALTTSDGRIRLFKGFRVHHSSVRGPYKGGLRFHPQICLEESCDLAALMTWKTALAGLPFGGAKGGVNCDPNELDGAELERLTKLFTEKILDEIGPHRDIPAPDVGTNEQVMAWIYDRYSKAFGNEPAVVTGKPVALGGLAGRNESTGFGVALVTKTLSENG